MSPERHAMAGNHARVTTAAFSHQCKGIREIFACEIRNPEEKKFLRNTESLALESGIPLMTGMQKNKESGIH